MLNVKQNRLLIAVLLIASLALAACMPIVAPSPAPMPETPADIAKVVVTGIAHGDADAVKYFQNDFVDHESGSDGTAALAERLAATSADYPDADTRIYRVIAEGELVFVHSHLVLEPESRGTAIADFFRFKDKLITEHWRIRQDVPETTASGNDMFSTLSEPQQIEPDPKVDVADTYAVMGALGKALGVDKDLSAWDRYTQPPYYQHSTNTPNGIEAVKEIWGPVIADTSMVITPGVTLAEGDLFVTMNLLDSPKLHITTVDISRVRGGFVLEHWDVVQFR